MKKKAFNYLLFTLAFFSLFFSGIVYAENTSAVPVSIYSIDSGHILHLSGSAGGVGANWYYGVEGDGSADVSLGGGDNPDQGSFYNGLDLETFCVNGSPGDCYIAIYSAGRVLNAEIAYQQFYRIGTNLWVTSSSVNVNSNINWFTSPNWKVVGSQATSTLTPTFTFTYWINPAELTHYNVACVYYRKVNLDNASSTTQEFQHECGGITHSGGGIFSTNLSLENNTLYTYYGTIYGTSTQPYNLDSLHQFLQIGFVEGSQIIPAGWNEPLQENSTSTIGFLGYLNIPSLLKTKVPFAYFFQLTDQLQNLNSIASSSVPVGSFDWYLPGYGTTTVDLFSPNNVRHFLTPTRLAILRNLMVAVTYFSTGWMLYHEAKRKHLLS